MILLPYVIALLVSLFAFQADLPHFDADECIVDITEDARVDCGTLIVPENRDDPDSGVVRLPVIIIKAQTNPAAPDPLVYTAGGPGSTSLGPVTFFRNSSLGENRDVILFEQRGAPFSEPALACPEIGSKISCRGGEVLPRPV